MNVDRVDVTSFGDTNKTYVQGLPDIAGRFEGNYDDTENILMAARGSADGSRLYLYVDQANAPGRYAYGPAWIDVSVRTEVTGAVKVSGSFAANGAWGVLF